MRPRFWTVCFLGLLCCGAFAVARGAWAADGDADLSSARVKDAIEHVQRYFGTIQNGDGSFGFRSAGPASYYGNTGVTGLVVLALLSSGLPPDQPVVANGLKFLRRSLEPQGGFETYQASVMLMALAAAKQPERDKLRIQNLAHRLEGFQVTWGKQAGMWNYGAISAWRTTATASLPSWPSARPPWRASRSTAAHGNWPLHILWTRRIRTAAGDITSTTQHGKHDVCRHRITGDLRPDVQLDEDDLNPDGTPKCCNLTPHSNRALRRGLAMAWTPLHYRHQSG